MDYKVIILLLVLACNFEITLSQNVCDEEIIKDPVGHKICEYNRFLERQVCRYSDVIIGKTVICKSIEMTQLKLYIDNWTSTVDFPVTFKVINSDIPIWPTSAFKNKQTLFAIYLEDINTQKIMPGAFNNIDSLKELYLKGNKMTTVSDGIFNSLTKLEKLDLSCNQIQNITNHAFIGGNLQTLYLNNNNISQIEQELVDSLSNLQTLDLANNNLRAIQNFSNLSLRTLNMSNNELSFVDFKLLQSVSFEIDLSYNNILVSELVNCDLLKVSKLTINNNNIKELGKNENILQLDVTHNQLEVIGSHVFGSSLNLLHLGNNSITSINADTFIALKNLEYLTLNNNNLSSLPNYCFRDLVSLKLLDLSGNKFTHFTYGTFDSLEELRTINISGNKLINLQLSIFHSLHKLTNLYFANNGIRDVDIDDLSRMNSLGEVDMTGNVWSCKNLLDMIHSLKTKNVRCLSGNFFEESNINGMKCYETSEISRTEEKSDANIDDSKLTRFYNEYFTKTVMYKYFNEEFKDSYFFKYLENLKNTINDTRILASNAEYLQALTNEIKLNINNNTYRDDFAESEVYNYFNKNFKKSGFFKYLETFKDQETQQKGLENIVGNQLDEIINLLKNTTKDKSTDLLLPNKDKNMHNYFDKDFRNSSVFKYEENFYPKIHEERISNSNDSKMEKLLSSTLGQKPIGYSNNYTGLLTFIVILLAIMLCVQIGTIFLNTMRIKKRNLLKKEDVELIEKQSG